jgi:hypothetical protein
MSWELDVYWRDRNWVADAWTVKAVLHAQGFLQAVPQALRVKVWCQHYDCAMKIWRHFIVRWWRSHLKTYGIRRETRNNPIDPTELLINNFFHGRSNVDTTVHPIMVKIPIWLDTLQ